MTNFGEYRLCYYPAEWGSGSMDPEIRMNISAEANLSQMVDFFESFLKAAGYQFESLSYKTTPEKVQFNFTPDPVDSRNDFWNEDDYSLVGNPYVTVGSGLQGGGWGMDHLFINPPCTADAVIFS